MNLQKNKGLLLLKGGKVYDPFIKLNGKKDILIKDDSIVAVDKNIPKKTNYKVIDCSNTIITNGFLDLHVHFREPGFEYKETLKTGAESAFSGGFTRVCVIPNTKPVLDSP